MEKNIRDITAEDVKIEAFTSDEIDAGEALFKKPIEFVLSVAKLEQLPSTNLPEIAFVGRSNVGKSSLVNAITNHGGLAKTSNTPGRTQLLNYFSVNNEMYLVDLPGYGYAQAPENLVKNWTKLVFAYLLGRAELKRVFLLIDSRHGIKKVDLETMELLDKSAVNYQIILTKTDKINKADLAKVLKETQAEITKHAAAHVRVIATSSEKKEGLAEFRAEVAKLLQL